MTVSEDLLLVALDPMSGRVRLSSAQSAPVLGGAALIRLVEAGRLAVEGSGRRARLGVVDPTPVDDPVLQDAFDRIRQHGRLSPKAAVTRLGGKQRRPLLESMQRSGLVGDREERILLVPVERFDLLDPARRDHLVSAVRAVLVQGQPADATTGPLIALLQGGGLLRLVVDRAEQRAAKRRAAQVLSEGADAWASDAVRQAIAAAQAAMTAVLMTVTVAGSTGSS